MNTKHLCLSILFSSGILLAYQAAGEQQDAKQQEELQFQQVEAVAQARAGFAELIRLMNEFIQRETDLEIRLEATEENFKRFCQLISEGTDPDEIFKTLFIEAILRSTVGQ